VLALLLIESSIRLQSKAPSPSLSLAAASPPPPPTAAAMSSPLPIRGGSPSSAEILYSDETNILGVDQPSRIQGVAIPSYPGRPSMISSSSSQLGPTDEYQGSSQYRHQHQYDQHHHQQQKEAEALPDLRPRKRGRGGDRSRHLGEGRVYMPDYKVDTYIPDYDRNGDGNVGSARYGIRRRVSCNSCCFSLFPSRPFFCSGDIYLLTTIDSNSSRANLPLPCPSCQLRPSTNAALCLLPFQQSLTSPLWSMPLSRCNTL
jgi:hypothetical protein